MIEQILIDKVTDVKPGRNGSFSSKIHSGNDFWYVPIDATQYANKRVEIDWEEKTSQKGNKYRVATIEKTVSEQPAYANGATQPWSEWESMAARAHALAKVLEPDEFVFPPQGGSEDPERFVRV